MLSIHRIKISHTFKNTFTFKLYFFLGTNYLYSLNFDVWLLPKTPIKTPKTS